MVSKAFICSIAVAALLGSAFAQTSSFVSTSGTGQAGGSATSSSTSSSGSSSGGTTGQATSQQPSAGGAPQPPAPPLPSMTTTLPPFSSISLCSPINLLVVTNATGGYSFTLEAEQGVMNYVNASVNGEVLSIGTNGGFATNETIKMTVSLPADKLSAIDHYGPGASIYVSKGFKVPSIDLTTAFGAGQLYVDTINADNVTIDMSGIGPVVATGTLGSVTATSNSIATLYLGGVQTGVQLTLMSTAGATIDQAPTSTITGTASGINSVLYSAGQCQVTSAFSTATFSLPVCTQSAFLSVPPPTPTWTCGIQVEGNFTCRPGTVLSTSAGGSSVSSAPDGASSSSQFQSATAQPGAASGLAAVSGSGPVSSSAVSSSSGGTGGSLSSTTTTQNGATTSRFASSSGGGTVSSVSSGQSPGVVISYGPNDSAQATVLTCNVPPASTRIPVE